MKRVVKPGISRRWFISGCAAAGALGLFGCSDNRAQPESKAASANGSVGSPAEAEKAGHLVLHKDPNCGCCEAWANISRKAGFRVEVVEHAEMDKVKERLGVPDDLRSCHTSEVAGYVVEGHVPLDDVRRLLEERPPGVAGIAVPVMPRGSPGMETADGTTDPYQVIAFDRSGKRTIFTQYPGSSRS